MYAFTSGFFPNQTSTFSIGVFAFAICTKLKLVKPHVRSLVLSLDLEFFVSKPLPTAINLLSFF